MSGGNPPELALATLNSERSMLPQSSCSPERNPVIMRKLRPMRSTDTVAVSRSSSDCKLFFVISMQSATAKNPKPIIIRTCSLTLGHGTHAPAALPYSGMQLAQSGPTVFRKHCVRMFMLPFGMAVSQTPWSRHGKIVVRGPRRAVPATLCSSGTMK